MLLLVRESRLKRLARVFLSKLKMIEEVLSSKTQTSKYCASSPLYSIESDVYSCLEEVGIGLVLFFNCLGVNINHR